MYQFAGKRNYEHFEFKQRNGAKHSNKSNNNNTNKKRSLPRVPRGADVGNDNYENDDYINPNYLSTLRLPDLPTVDERQQRVDFFRREMRYQQMPQWDFSVPQGIDEYMRNPKRRYQKKFMVCTRYHNLLKFYLVTEGNYIPVCHSSILLVLLFCSEKLWSYNFLILKSSNSSQA